MEFLVDLETPAFGQLRPPSPIVDSVLLMRTYDEGFSSDESDEGDKGSERIFVNDAALRRRGILLDVDGTPAFEPLRIALRTRTIHLPDDFYTKPLPVDLSRPPKCTCPRCTGHAESSDNSSSYEISDTPRTLSTEWGTPMRYFLQIWPREMFETLAQHTNEYAQQQGAGASGSRSWRPTSAPEMMIWIGIIIYLGVYKCGGPTGELWDRSGETPNHCISRYMSSTRWH